MTNRSIRSSYRSSQSLLRGMMFTYIGFVILLPLAAVFLEISKRPWNELWRIVSSPLAVSTYQISLTAALTAALINSVFGVILAWIFVRYDFPGKRFADGLVDLPFAMPSVVAGMTLLAVYGPNGLIGAPLGGLFRAFGGELNLTSSFFGVVLAELFVTLPFVVRTVQPVLIELDPGVEEAASTMGATTFQTFQRVVFPQLLPAIITGFTLAFARAVGEYGVVLLLSGNIPFETMVTSIYIYNRFEEFDYAGATALAIVLLLFSITFLVGTNFLQAWSRRYQER